MFLHFETHAFANPQKAEFPGRSGAQLDFLPHIYEARSQVRPRIWEITTFFEDLRTHMFQSVER